jgi:hypothetical protein
MSGCVNGFSGWGFMRLNGRRVGLFMGFSLELYRTRCNQRVQLSRRRAVTRRACAGLGHVALGIADHNSLAGVVRAHMAAKAVGLRLLVGAQLVFADERR